MPGKDEGLVHSTVCMDCSFGFRRAVGTVRIRLRFWDLIMCVVASVQVQVPRSCFYERVFLDCHPGIGSFAFSHVGTAVLHLFEPLSPNPCADLASFPQVAELGSGGFEVGLAFGFCEFLVQRSGARLGKDSLFKLVFLRQAFRVLIWRFNWRRQGL